MWRHTRPPFCLTMCAPLLSAPKRSRTSPRIPPLFFDLLSSSISPPRDNCESSSESSASPVTSTVVLIMSANAASAWASASASPAPGLSPLSSHALASAIAGDVTSRDAFLALDGQRAASSGSRPSSGGERRRRGTGDARDRAVHDAMVCVRRAAAGKISAKDTGHDAATFVRGDFRATAVAAWFTHLARLPIDANLVHGVHPIVDMSAVSLVNIASPSRVAVERVFAAGRTTASFLPPTPRRSARSVRGTCAAAAAPRDENSGRATFKNPKATSTVVRMAFGELEPTASVPAARKPLAETLGAIAQTLWGLRRGAVMLAFALGLALVDAGPALAGRGGRSGGRMGGSSFRSTSARSMGGGGMGGGMGGGGGGSRAGSMGAGAAGAGAAGAQRQPMGMGGPRFLFMPSFGPFGYGGRGLRHGPDVRHGLVLGC